MKRKIYKLLSSTKQGLFALALTVFSGTAYSQATYTLNYTGSVQTLNLQAGTFDIKMWGGDGYTQTAGFNGKGGYASGILTLASAQTIYIYVGGLGSYPSTGVTANAWTFNGGGIGYPANNASYGNGGGASDVRTVGGTWDNPTSLASRAIVAGGGSAGRNSSYIGGNGGGLTGGTGTYFSPDQTGGPTGGSQITGGTNTGYTSGLTLATLGKAMTWDGNTLTASFLAGGGGGYYGGASGRVAGGGGSSYIGGVTSGTTIMYGQPSFVSNPDITGNGKVIITELCNITLIATGTNSNGAICSGGSVTLTTNAISNYSWSTGATTSSLVVSPTSTTLYSLTATSPSNCTTSAALTITVDQGIPTLTVVNTASATSGICPSKTVALTASGATTYTWIGGSSTVTNGVVFAPTSTSGYTVTGGNACGTSTAATSISIHPLPNVTAVASTASLCSGLNLTLTGVGNSTAYVWSGGSIPITNGVGFAPSLTNTYTVIGTSALSCTASATVPVTVVTTPANFPTQNTGIVCIGGSSTLTATGATSYTWASATQTVFTPTFVVTPNIGTTTYTVTKSNANCFDTKTISVVTNSLPTIFAIVNPTIVCALNPATLAVGGGQSYTWTAPGSPNFTFTGSTPVVSPPVSTTYSVAAFDGTCVTTTTVFLAANPNPTITTTASSPSICSGNSVTLNANGGINYTWTATTGTFYTQSITDAPTIATAYNVSGDNVFGCITGASTVVLVNPNPVIGASASKILVCSGGASTLSASGANTYTWDANANGALTSSTIVNPTSPTSAVMIYTVQGSNSFPCQSSQTVQVAVFVPTLTVTGNTNTCYGGAIQLGAGGGNINTYVWYTSIGGSPYGFQTLNTTVTAAAVYTVNAVTSTLSVVCPATQTVAVGVYYNPTITATPDRTLICTKESVDLYGGGGVSYSWSNGTPGGTITVSPTNNTTYTVTGTDANGCVGTGTVLVKVSGCAGINELSNVNNGLVLYPNPNNGEFVIEANTEITLTLVNELGQVIKTINLSGTNNYKTSVTDLAKGIYFISGQKDNVQINQKVVVVK